MNANFNAARGRHHERGAVAVFVGVFIVALVAVLLLVLDIGRLYYAQRQLENDANMAALAGAQIVSGCGGSAPGLQGSLSAVTEAVTQSLTDNRGTVGGYTDLGSASTLLSTGINGSPSVELGKTVLATDGKTRTFQALTAGDPQIDSVRVNLTAPQPQSFLSVLFGSGNTTKLLYASATAKHQNVASFSIGTGLLSLNTSQSALLNTVLGQLLGTSVNLSAVSYQGLASTTVTLGQLATTLGLATLNPDGSLGPLLTSNLGIANLLGAVAQGTGSTVLQTLANGAQGSLQLEQVLGLSTPLSGAINALPINVAQLLFDAAAVVGRNKPIAIGTALNLGALASAGVTLNITQPPQIGAGIPGKDANGNYYAYAKSAQITLGVRASALQIPPLTSVTLGTDVQVAQATAGLDSLTCSTSQGGPVAKVTVIPNAVSLSAGTFSGSATASPAPTLTSGTLINLLLLVRVNLTGLASAASGSASGQQVTFSPPYPAGPTRVSTGFDLGSLTTSLTTDFLGKLQVNVLGLLSIPTGTLLSELGSALSSVVNVLSDTTITPLLQLLGVQIGYADTSLLSVSQGQPVIQTNCLPGASGANGCPTPATN